MKEFIISEELAQTILNYLIGRPYAEVYRMVAALQTLKPVEKKEEPKE